MTPSRRLSLIIASIGGFLALGVALVAAGDLYRRYGESITTAERRAAVVTQIVTEHVARTFDAIDRVLLASTESFLERLAGRISTLEAARQRLRAIQSGSPMLLGLAWIDAEGRRTVSTDTSAMPETASAARSESFAASRKAATAGLFIGHPYRLAENGPWLLPVSRRVTGPDGVFLGVVEGVVNGAYFLATYSGIDASVGAAVTVFRDDGVSLIRSEQREEFIGESAARGPLFNIWMSEERNGTIQAESPFDRATRILSYRRVPDLPLIAAVSFEKSAILRPWLASLVISGGLTLVVVIAILAFTGWVMALAAANERTRQELAAQTKRADAASRAKSDFLATMSHEVRTPMTGIIGYSDLLFQAEPDPTLKEYARVVGDSARALLSILDDILDLSIIEAGRLTLREGPVDPVEIVADAVAIITAGARDKGVVTATHVDADVPRNLIGDRDRLRQVVANLLGNAVKFTERGRIDVSVERLGQVDGGEEIRISVADTGIGIPKQDLGRLFQRFTQVDNSIARRFGGTGLGLAICKNLVERMGGRIGVDSEPGRGSTFWFTVTLPLDPTVAEEPEEEASADLSAAGRVLVVDDNAANLTLVEAMLGAAGHQVDTARNGSIALERVTAADYDVVLMDLSMPVMDGFEATSRIRALPLPKSSVAIVALTASSSPEEVERCRRAGMDGHVAKPIETLALLTAVAEHIRPTADAHG